jgi:hypothetical protein
MSVDFMVAMIQATVLVGQVPGGAPPTVATGFLVSAPRPDGTPRVVLVTAAHVFERIGGPEARIGFHIHNPDGSWGYGPQNEPIAEGGHPLWTRHPTRDVAVLTLQVPPEIARLAVPAAWLADRGALERYDVEPGDEMSSLGFPEGLASDRLGFPILRVGRVASYPLTAGSPTFLLDFRVFAGHSGGPVFVTRKDARRPGLADADPDQAAQPGEFIAGVLTQQITPGGEQLDLGMVTQAAFVREAIALLDQDPPAAGPAPAPPSVPGG